MPDCSASWSREEVGSTPGDNTKISGVFVVESSTTCVWIGRTESSLRIHFHGSGTRGGERDKLQVNLFSSRVEKRDKPNYRHSKR